METIHFAVFLLNTPGVMCSAAGMETDAGPSTPRHPQPLFFLSLLPFVSYALSTK